MKKEYEKLRKKYSLPSFEKLNNDFQIESIEEKGQHLLQIAKKMSTKASDFSNLLEETLSPEARLGSMTESGAFTENEKKKILTVFRKLNYQYRLYTKIDISYDEIETAKFINKFFEEWELIKPDLKTIINKMVESWNHNKKTNVKLGYFG